MSAGSELLEQLIRPIVEKILDEREVIAHSPFEGYLTVKDAAQLSGIREQTIRKWISHKRVPFSRAGRSVRVRLSDILKEED